METTLMTFLTLVAWLVAIIASIGTFRRLATQGELVRKAKLIGGKYRNVPMKWYAICAIASWLWIIAGCLS